MKRAKKRGSLDSLEVICTQCGVLQIMGPTEVAYMDFIRIAENYEMYKGVFKLSCRACGCDIWRADK